MQMTPPNLHAGRIRGRLCIVWLLAVIAGGSWSFSASYGRSNGNSAPEGRHLFNNSLVPPPAKVAATMRAETRERLEDAMEIQIPLRMRDFSEFQRRIASGARVPEAELERDYYPLAADYEAVAQWLRSEGFVITGSSAARLSLFARGSIRQIQKSFQVEMVQVVVDGKHYHTARTSPSLPEKIASPVLGVNGLQPYLKLKRHSSGMLPQTANKAPFLVSEIEGAYSAQGLGVTGSGQTIAILIDTFASSSDLTSFWSANSVVRTGTVEEVNVTGTSTLDTPSGEETLDEEWTSGIAPGADIRVYASGDLSFTSLDKALVRIVSDVSGSSPAQPNLHQLSISLGIGEGYLSSTSQMATDSQYFATLANAGVSVFAASGDGGSDPTSSGGTGGHTAEVNYYASDPSVTGVGGTSLTLNSSTGAVSSETAWADSGGGVSSYFSRPAWQVGTGVVSGSMRLVPDVSLVADPNTGAYVVLSGTVYTYGGTSLSTPVWAGFCALINEARAKAGIVPAGLLNVSIYPLFGTSNFRDITSGNNGSYSAGTGYDLVTGIGVPVVSTLLQTLSGTSNNNTACPAISGFTPATGAVSSSVVITGSNFTGASAVTFNSTSAVFSVSSATQITATVPSGATTGPITVTNAVGTGTSSSSFTVSLGTTATTGTTTLYSTQFETSEGYVAGDTLSGQNGWLISGQGSNGIVTGYFSGEGNQAYIGYSAPPGTISEAVYQPIDYTPQTGDTINFSVQLDIVDSTGFDSPRDVFRWSVYNTAAHRLFSIAIDNATNLITYVLEDGSTYSNASGVTLVNGTIYTLNIALDFTNNLWGATLSGSTLASNQPLTSTGAALTLGEIDAAWLLSSSWAGNNYMLFDNYSITRVAPVYPVAASASPASGGTVTGGGTYMSGSAVTLTAAPATGFIFADWEENGNPVSTSTSYSFTVSGSETLLACFLADSFTAWQETYFTAAQLADSSVSGPQANPSGDGVSNLLKYAFSSDPMVADRSALPQTAIENGALTLTYTVNKIATDLTYTVEVSSDMVTWNSGTAYTTLPEVVTDGTDFQTVEVADLVPVSSVKSRFIRLRVATP